jgi:hypothetical protein
MKTISDDQQRLINDAIGELSLALSPAILEKDILVTEALRAISQVSLPTDAYVLRRDVPLEGLPTVGANVRKH